MLCNEPRLLRLPELIQLRIDVIVINYLAIYLPFHVSLSDV